MTALRAATASGQKRRCNRAEKVCSCLGSSISDGVSNFTRSVLHNNGMSERNWNKRQREHQTALFSLFCWPEGSYEREEQHFVWLEHALGQPGEDNVKEIVMCKKSGGIPCC